MSSREARQALIQELALKYPKQGFTTADKAMTGWAHDPTIPDILVGFVDEESGVLIHNPFISSCGRFETHPSIYGMEVYDAHRIAVINGFQGANHG
jgi:hypothetical protein